MYEFNRRLTDGRLATAFASAMLSELDIENQDRLRRLPEFWNFYEGFHWESIPSGDKPETTKNFCRRFVNKFVAAEFGGVIVTGKQLMI